MSQIIVQQMVEDLAGRDGLSSWEIDFLDGLLFNDCKNLTDSQLAKIKEIHAKHCE